MACFLSLPVEIRLQIYQEFVIPRTWSISRDQRGVHTRWLMSHNFSTSILQVCKTIYYEASIVLYKHSNSILFISTPLNPKDGVHIKSSLERIAGSTQFQHFQKCVIRLWWDSHIGGRLQKIHVDKVRAAMEETRHIFSEACALQHVDIRWQIDRTVLDWRACLEPLFRKPKHYEFSLCADQRDPFVCM